MVTTDFHDHASYVSTTDVADTLPASRQFSPQKQRVLRIHCFLAILKNE